MKRLIFAGLLLLVSGCKGWREPSEPVFTVMSSSNAVVEEFVSTSTLPDLLTQQIVDDYIMHHSTMAFGTGKLIYDDYHGNHWVTVDREDEFKNWRDGLFHQLWIKTPGEKRGKR